MPIGRAVAALLCVAPLTFAADTLELLERKLLERIEALDAATDGVIGVSAIDLTSGRTFAYNADAVFPQASVIKIAIMVEAFRAGRLHEKVTLTPAEAKPGGDLYSPLQRGPLTLTARELVAHMIQSSDNTATNRLIAMLGMDRINATIRQLGLRETRLQRMMLDSAAVRRSDDNVSTPAEMAQLAALIHARKVSGAEEMIAIMKDVDGDFRKTVPGAVEVVSKVGEYPGTRTETAIVLLKNRPYAVSVCGTFLRPGANPIPDLAAAIHGYFERIAASNRYGNRVE